jgi:hypothetical protein
VLTDASAPLNSDPSLVPAQPAVSRVFLPHNQPRVPLAQMPQPDAPPTNPAPVAPVQSGNMNNLWGLLTHLFGGSTPGPPQGMRGLMQPPAGRGAPGTDRLGNPLGRF